MTEPSAERFASLQRRYQERNLPWDLPLPPPEIVTLAATLPPGRALDLGCGVGRTCIHLAAAGWEVDGVDFVPEAITLAT
ncbi:MAG: methyltransferase domain-containing protein, partial [Chloroflexia bacterium]|nr:methyltransferase domain-containing protein [Chloroflexia bacterium]